ncbi:unnamed protein product [Victoria cruziana]
MEGTRYWTWSRRNFGVSRNQSAASFHGSSWEEQAFAEDSSGLLGGCIWPPRSYSCTFCRREFRSAQALGGHMNVHRRDRARLRRSPSLQNEGNHNPCGLLDLHQYRPAEVCTLVYPNPNPNPNPNPIVVPSPKASAPPASCCNDNCSEQAFNIPSCQKPSFFSSPAKASNPLTVQIVSVPVDSKTFKGNLNCDAPKLEDRNGSSDSFCRRRKLDLEALDSDDESAVSKKRARTSAADTLPLFIGRTTVSSEALVGQHCLKTEVLGRTQSAIEELDLELRLGQRPEVK